MKRKEFRYVDEVVENEGFDYAFVHYTDFRDTVTDSEFHRLREAFLAARKALVDYAGLEYV